MSTVRALALRVRNLEHGIEIKERLAGFDDGGPPKSRVFTAKATEGAEDLEAQAPRNFPG